MERSIRRTVIVFAVFIFCMVLSILSVYTIANGTELAQTAAKQSTYKLTVAKTRGTIYDCNKVALTGGEKEYIAAISPTVEGAAALSKVLSQEEMSGIYSQFTDGKPFLTKLPSLITAQGVRVFERQKRYSDQQIASHVIGYLDGTQTGISGIEKAFQEVLTQNQGEITVTYKVDALNRALAGEDITVNDTTYLQNSGVVLTLDKGIQQAAETAARKYLTSGAVIVTEVPTCKIRAMVSLPDFNPNNLADALNGENSPLVNKAISAYNVGSVFKLVSAAAALEYGISPNLEYECTGSIDVTGAEFRCYNSESHAKEDMKGAISQSCNTYFINIMQQVPQSQFLSMARLMGFGEKMEIAPGISAAEGTLPALKSLKNQRALANFSFGQGDLTATPLQISAMVNAIASGGLYTQPYLYEGIVDEKQEFVEKAETKEQKRVMTEQTAALLQEFMVESVENGTSKRGKPERGGAAAKTATAQTGKFVGEKELVQSWFAGYFPKENPKYVITVFEDGGKGGGITCAPVFKEIADALNA